MFPSSNAAASLDNAVLFLFAHQRLVFRYPLTNPFEVTPSNSAATGGGASTAAADRPAQSSTATAGTPSHQAQASLPSGDDASSHIGVPSITLTDAAGGASTGGSSINAPQLTVSSNALHGAVPAALSVPSSVGKMPSCAGFDTGTMMFLLRNSFSRLTTLRIGLCSLLVWPLLNVKGEAMLVVALRDPDDAYAHVSRYIQVYVNILLREEQRCQYVTHQIEGMLAELDAAGGPLTATSVALAIPSAASPAGTHNFHLKKNRLGCLTAAAYSGGDSNASLAAPTAPTASYLAPTGVPDLDAFARAAHCASGLFLELRLVAETANGVYHDDIVVNQLLVLPHSHLSGQVRHRRQVLASFSSRYDSGAIVTIADAAFADTRREQYEHVVGRDIAALMPLDDVHRVFAKIPPPWTLFAVRAALEAFLLKRMASAPKASSSAMGADDESCMVEGGVSGVTGTLSSGDNAISPNDAPFIIFEVMEFLRLFGAVTFHVQRICFTKGSLAPVAPSGRCGFASGCIFGSTCYDCSTHTSSSGGGGGPATPTVHDDGKTTHGSGHQELLFRHYNSVYDDPWFLASEVEHRANESALVPGNRHPAVRVYERAYEVAPPPLAPHAQLLKKSSSSMLDASLSGGECTPSPKATTTSAPKSTSTGGLCDVADVHTSAAQWLLRHGREIQRRINSAEVLPCNAGLMQQPHAAPTSLIASLEPDAIDSRGSLTRRRFQQQQHQLASARGGCTSGGSAADDGLLPTGVLLQVVVHVVVALLWRGNPQDGEPLSFDDIVGRVELTLRRFAPMLRNMAYVTRRMDALHHYHEAVRGGAGHADVGPPLSHEAPAATKTHPPPMPLTAVELRIVAFSHVVGALQLTHLVSPHYGREIRRIQCRSLVHAAVNMLPDVLSVGVFPSNLPSGAAI